MQMNLWHRCFISSNWTLFARTRAIFLKMVFCYKVDKKAINDQEPIDNRIPHPTLNIKRERDTYSYDGTKIKTAQAKSQGDSSFPTDGHKATLNKFNSKSKISRTRMNIDN